MEQAAGEREALADVEVYDYAGETRRRRVAVVVVVVVGVVVVGLALWQLFSLHHQIHQLRQSGQAQTAQNETLQREVTQLRSSLNAAVGCLQTPQAQLGLCSKLVH